MKSLAILFTAALLLAVVQARKHYAEEVCADAGPDCFTKASTCGELMKPNDEYRKKFREAFVTCAKKNNDSSEEESHESADHSQEENFAEHEKCVMEETGFMTGWEVNRDNVKAYLSSLTLSEEVMTAMESAADTCEGPTVSNIHAFDKCMLAACIEVA
ncbi:uncharacterized protein LOC134776595 [Penaeus indicus]|uniref:uncharacterized protein LOC134776595 n=1 Tax=Penaeus indicus TaxID=29960 RepID=UPI00300C8A55